MVQTPIKTFEREITLRIVTALRRWHKICAMRKLCYSRIDDGLVKVSNNPQPNLLEVDACTVYHQVETQMPQLLEVVRVCPYCKRESTVPAMEWEENPYCHACLRERLEAAKQRRGPVSFSSVGNYGILTPIVQTDS
jgi:hypothetical protein